MFLSKHVLHMQIVYCLGQNTVANNLKTCFMLVPQFFQCVTEF